MIPKELLPADLMGSAFIAGGYAACPALARDLDVWVLAPEAEDLESARERILAHLESTMWPYEALDWMTEEYGTTHAMLVATVRSSHLTHPVQILVTHSQPIDLLETFDISTHQVALVLGNVVKGSSWTPVTEPPVMLRRSPSTPVRMAKIAKRFGHPAPFDILNPEVR